MDKISRLIPKVLNKRGLGDQAVASYVVYLAKEWFSEHLDIPLDGVHVTALSEGILCIESDHAIVSQELHQQTDELLVYLNKIDSVSVREVRIIRKK